ncbi:MAG: biopolymer transporter ExbD [Phycisphaerae bacterium]|nr:biopolymer transporter ExbD [Phycisphaerae bacterium]
MRLTRQIHKPPRPELNTASLIDVVFLLLIFFMCTASFAVVEKSLPAQLPKAGPGDTARRELLDTVRIRLSQSDAGTAMTCDGLACESVEALAEMLQARRALGDPPVIIEGVGDVPFGHMVGALDACHQAQLYRVAFSDSGAAP